jgi:hypothetical protein
MFLGKSPTLTPAVLASQRRNARKFTGPRTARGKATSSLNRLRHGGRSPEYLGLLTALMEAPPGLVMATARTLLSGTPMPRPPFMEAVETSIQVEIGMCEERR